MIFLSLVSLLLSFDDAKPPHPDMKYCMATLITVEVTQYRARPLGNDKVRKANIIGIIHNIIWL